VPLRHLTDENLLEQYRDTGQAGAFDELVRRYSAPLLRYLGRYLRDRALAEDVLQETLLRVHTRCHLYRNGRPVRPWLYAIAAHQAIDAQRRSRRHSLVSLHQPADRRDTYSTDFVGALVDLAASNAPPPLEALIEAERQTWVRESVSRMPDAMRQTLILAYYQGLKYTEIANLLAIPLGTVKSRVHAAIAWLRERAEAGQPVRRPTPSLRHGLTHEGRRRSA
jgi:RNA polymerase sigma-70 factor (ECF subfamily)